MAASSPHPSLTKQQPENGGISNVDGGNTLGATLDDYTQTQGFPAAPFYDTTLATLTDSDVGWQAFHHNDYLITHQNESEEATANILRDLASLDEHHPLDDVLLWNNSTFPQKRKREEGDETYQMDSTKPVTVVEARRMMNEVVSKRTSARHCLQMAHRQLQACQQYVDVAQRDVKQAENDVSEVSQQLCDELLQEDTSWNATYKLLLKFRERHGHTSVPRNPCREQKEADPYLSKLAGWIGRQRTNYRRPSEDNRRPEDYQIIALERVGFDFDPHRTAWMKRYGELKEFKATHGHFDVSLMKTESNTSGSDEEEYSSELENSSHTTTSGESESNNYSSLATWMKRQQHQYRAFREGDPKSEMTEERIRLLDDIGFPWRKRAKLWMEHYNALKTFKEEHGHTQPPNTSKQLKGLSDWAKNQRKQLKRYEEDPSSSSLSEEQVALLKKLPLDGNLRATSWSTRFHELMDFKKRHGHCVLPTKYPLNQKLASWVSTQRRQYQLLMEGKPSQMTEERIKILTNADFEWKVSAQRREETSRALVKSFDEIYAELLDRRNETGTLDVGKSGDLREWLNTYQYQYQRFKAGKSSQLSPDQVSKLTVLFDNEPSTTLPQKTNSEEDERKPPAKRAFAQSTTQAMNPKEISSVEVAPQVNRSWEESYTELLTHRVKYNSFQIPTAHPLYPWTQEQRTEYEKYVQGRSSALTSERISKLNFVGFPWNENGRSTSTNPVMSWEEMFAELLSFRIRFQSFDVPPENHLLRCWMATQRRMLQNHMNAIDQSDLAKERIRKLHEIGFPWDDDDDDEQVAGMNGYTSVQEGEC